MLTHLVGFSGLVFFFFLKVLEMPRIAVLPRKKKNVITLLNYFHKIILPGNGDWMVHQDEKNLQGAEFPLSLRLQKSPVNKAVLFLAVVLWYWLRDISLKWSPSLFNSVFVWGMKQFVSACYQTQLVKGVLVGVLLFNSQAIEFTGICALLSCKYSVPDCSTLAWVGSIEIQSLSVLALQRSLCFIMLMPQVTKSLTVGYLDHKCC